MVAGFSLISVAQNVTENKVSTNYIQLPTNVIAKQYTVYNVVVERNYEKSNEDSLSLYQSRLESASAVYDAQMISWRQMVKDMDRNYLVQMANWEKQTNAGTVSSQPKRPTYPKQPVMEEIEMPQLHSEMNESRVNQAVALQGFTKGAGGAVITVEVMPISNVQIVESKTGTVTETKYKYTCNYQMPMGLKVEVPGQGIVLQTIVSNGLSAYNLKSDYGSKYDYQLWMMDNKEQFWTELQQSARNKALTELNQVLNNKCGFPIKNRVTEVYTIKKFKDHSYTDLTNAYTIASQGYSKLSQSRDRKEAKAKLLEAIAAWKEILKESNLSDNKSRINDKVTALLYCNIAEAYIWLSQYEDAEQYINLAASSGVGKFKRRAGVLSSLLKERRLRWNSYFG